MSRKEILEVLENDMLVPYMNRWELEYIINFVILNYDENRDN
jgi:hypothetical protein